MNVVNENNNDLNNKYKTGKIYKIVCNVTGKIYVGSTIKPLKIRLSGHKTNYNLYLNDKYHYVSSFDILKDGNYSIELICNAACISKKELHAIEGVYIRELECVNRFIPGRLKKEYNKQYYKSNLDNSKQYYKDNEDKIKNTKKEYYKNNVDIFKQYYKDNSAKLKQKFNCDCGGKYSNCHKARHINSLKHQNYLNL